MRNFICLALTLMTFGSYAQIFNLVPPTASKPTVTLTGTQAVVSWQYVTNANRYYMLPIRNGVQLSELIVASAHSYTVIAGSTYQFKVKAFNGNYDGIPDPANPSYSSVKVGVESKSLQQQSSEVCSQWSVASNAITGSGNGADVDFIADIPAVANVSVPAEQTASTSTVTLAGEFSVTNQGAATYNIPLTLPAGIGGFTPSLSIDYSSLGSNGDAGLGWNLSAASTISRCQKILEEDGLYQEVSFTNTDALCLGGEKLRLVAGSNLQSGAEYRLDKQPDIKVVQSSSGAGSYFTLYRPSGETEIFGDSDNSVQIDSLSGLPFSWLQSARLNLFGQQIEYQYQRQQDYAPL